MSTSCKLTADWSTVAEQSSALLTSVFPKQQIRHFGQVMDAGREGFLVPGHTGDLVFVFQPHEYFQNAINKRKCCIHTQALTVDAQ